MQGRIQVPGKLISMVALQRPRLTRAERAAADWALVDDHMALLDLCCGQGQLLAHFTQHHRVRACGICHDPQQAQEIRDRLDAGEIMYAAGAEVPWQDASFDRVFITRALPASVNPEELLRETLRVLRPDGKLLCVAGSLPFSRSLTLPWLKAGRPQALTRAEMIQLLDAQGFQDVALRQSRPGWAVAVGSKA